MAHPHADTANSIDNRLRPARQTLRRSAQRSRTDTQGVVREGQLSRQLPERAKNRTDAVASEASAASAKPRRSRVASGSEQSVPEAVQRRFVQVGNKYFFVNGTEAFADRGRTLTTRSENTQVIRALVAVAQARGWEAITVTGSERFRQQAWVAAGLAGLQAQGYEASQVEEARLSRRIARQRNAADHAADATTRDAVRQPYGPDPLRSAGPTFIAGQLIDHGRANYRHDPSARPSYFVRIETPRGKREIWGVDLERALRESQTQPKLGDRVRLRSVGKDDVTLRAGERNGEGVVLGERELVAHRNRWIIEQERFFDERAKAARVLRNLEVTAREATKTHPELAGAYLRLRAAELTSRQMRDRADQRTFVAAVRRSLADSLERGEPLPPVRLRERANDRARPSREREPAVAR